MRSRFDHKWSLPSDECGSLARIVNLGSNPNLRHAALAARAVTDPSPLAGHQLDAVAKGIGWRIRVLISPDRSRKVQAILIFNQYRCRCSAMIAKRSSMAALLDVLGGAPFEEGAAVECVSQSWLNIRHLY